MQKLKVIKIQQIPVSVLVSYSPPSALRLQSPNADLHPPTSICSVCRRNMSFLQSELQNVIMHHPEGGVSRGQHPSAAIGPFLLLSSCLSLDIKEKFTELSGKAKCFIIMSWNLLIITAFYKLLYTAAAHAKGDNNPMHPLYTVSLADTVQYCNGGGRFSVLRGHSDCKGAILL